MKSRLPARTPWENGRVEGPNDAGSRNWRSGMAASPSDRTTRERVANTVEAVTSIEFATPPTLSAPAGYSHVVSLPAAGRLVWTSGQVPVAADGPSAPAGDWEAQARLTFENVGHALAAGRRHLGRRGQAHDLRRRPRRPARHPRRPRRVRRRGAPADELAGPGGRARAARPAARGRGGGLRRTASPTRRARPPARRRRARRARGTGCRTRSRCPSGGRSRSSRGRRRARRRRRA